MKSSITTIALAAAAILAAFYGYLQSSNLGDEVARGRVTATALQKAEGDLKSARESAGKLEAAQKTAEAELKKARDEIGPLQAARKSAEDKVKATEAALKSAQDEAAKAATALRTMEGDLKAARDQASQLQAARATAEAAAKEAADKLLEERKVREAVEQALAAARRPTQ